MIGSPLPPPSSFAEGQRLVYGWLVAGAGMFCGAVACAVLAVLVWGSWPASFFGQIITILGFALGGFIVAMCFVIVGLLVGGPVGRFKAHVSKDGADLEAGKDEGTG